MRAHLKSQGVLDFLGVAIAVEGKNTQNSWYGTVDVALALVGRDSLTREA